MNFKKIQFRRVTSSGLYYPEVDGLRFIAIFSVVIAHFRAFIIHEDTHEYVDNFELGIIDTAVGNGGFGVSLFFMLSGLILGLPFAKYHFCNQKKVSLRAYFFRRLTRIEPPYLVVLILFFSLGVFVLNKFTFEEGLRSFLASLTYTHNFFYDRQILPLLLPPAWSLEVEVQFYILAPILAFIYAIKNQFSRNGVYILAIGVLICWERTNLPFVSIVNFFEYFLIGMLLAEIMARNVLILPKTKLDTLFTAVAFVLIWVINPNDHNDWYLSQFVELIRLVSAALLCYYVVIHKTFRLLSTRTIAYIGGMCYSIYLLHYSIIRFFGGKLVGYQFSDLSYVNIGIYGIILISLSLVVSAIFFILVERPCMDKNWYKKFIP